MKKILFFILICTLTVASSAFTSDHKTGFLKKDDTYYRNLARDIFKELIEINTSSNYGSTKADEGEDFKDE